MKKLKLITLSLSPIPIVAIMATACSTTKKEKEVDQKQDELTTINSNLQLEYPQNKDIETSAAIKEEIKPLNLPSGVVFSVKEISPKVDDESTLIVKYTLKKGNITKEFKKEINGFKKIRKDQNIANINDMDHDFKMIFDNIKLKDTFDFKLKGLFNSNFGEYDKLLPSQIVNNFAQGVETRINTNQDRLGIEVIDVSYPNENFGSANREGNLKMSLLVTDKKTKQVFIKSIIAYGFKTNAMGLDENGSIPGGGADLVKPKVDENNYFNKTQLERYEIDNQAYLNGLKGQHMGKTWQQVRPELGDNEQKIKEFDEKAKGVSQDAYASAAYKGFTLPVYDKNGDFKGLSINESSYGQARSWVDTRGRDEWKTTGLPRTLPNEKYRDEALQTLGISSLTLKDGKKDTWDKSSGTTWILDYQKTNDNKYPTKWYFATNLHVADTITDKTTSIDLMKLMDSVKTKTTLRLSNLDENIYRFGFASKNNEFLLNHGLKKIYDGRDFLKTKPTEYLTEQQKEKYKDAGSFVDFAVFELDFEQLKLLNVWNNQLNSNGGVITKYDHSSAQDLAKIITSDYANHSDKQIKFLSKSYLNDYSKIDVPLRSTSYKFEGKDELFALGWPNSTRDGFFERYVDDDQTKYRTTDNFSLWTNSDYRFFGKLTEQEGGQPAFPTERTERGNYLSYAIGYRSFIDKPGVLDAFISAPHTGNDLYKSLDEKKYINMGLEYMPRHYAPAGGASGSSVRNQNNEIVGIYHVSNEFASTGLATAFRSEGYDYKGLYGDKYKELPQYDLIYGGGKDQATGQSYREKMKEIYKNNNNIKTALFPNGFDQYDEKFKFNNNQSK